MTNDYFTVQARVMALQQMDNIMRNLDDEEYIMWWLEEGVPDGEDEWEWLTDDEYFLPIRGAFYAILKAYDKEYPNEILSQMFTLF